MLITIRRSFAVLLVPVFLLLFVATVLVFRVNATVLEAGFYTGTLERLDVYNFLYDEAVPFAVRESGVDLQAIPLGLDLTPEGISGYGKRVLPPEWLAENLGGAIEQAVPYITGRTDSFEITVRLDDRVEAAAEVARELVREADIHAYVLDEVVKPVLEESSAQYLENLPYGISLTTAQVLDGVKRVVPEDWLKARIEDALDQVVPYVTGKADSFSIHIPLQDRADASLDVVEDWLLASLEGGAYDYLLSEQMAPLVTDTLGAAVTLPYGVTITDEEIVDALGKVLPQEWVAERVSDAIAAVGPYITGRTDSFMLVVPLQDRLELAAETIVEVADAKLEEVYTSLPICSVAQLLDLKLTLAELPECRPPLVPYEALKTLVGLDVFEQVATSIVEPLPDSIELTEQSLFAAVAGTADEASIESVRQLLKDGYTFTDENLRTLLAENVQVEGVDVPATFEDIRMRLRDGFTFDDAQVRDLLGERTTQFDQGRSWLETGRSLLFLLVVLLAFFALLIGFLGGRRWGTRLVWAGVPVLLSGAIVGAVFGAASGPLRSFSDEPIQSLELNPVFIEKLVDVRDELVTTFVGPVRTQGLLTAALGFAMIAGGIFWAKRRRVELAVAVAAPAGPAEPSAVAAAASVASAEPTSQDEAPADEPAADELAEEAAEERPEEQGEDEPEKPRSDA